MRKIAIDTNVLVYAHVPQNAEHERVRAHLRALLNANDVVVCVTSLVMHELIHVITDARRFSPPVSMTEALAIARNYLTASNVECLPVDGPSTLLALGLLEDHALGRKRVADSLLAATLLEHDVTTLVTCNPGDFEKLGLTLIDPRSA